MTVTLAAAPIIVLDPDPREARQIADWLHSAGLGLIATARTCDEAIFMLGRQGASLLLIDDHVPEVGERRLLGHIAEHGGPPPAIVRLVGADSPDPLAVGRAIAAEAVRKPLEAHDLVFRVGTAIGRPDLVGRMDRNRDQAAERLAAARGMQVDLLPSASRLATIRDRCGVGIAGFYRPGEDLGGDFWGVWPTGRGRFALALVDFAGHGLGAALNTFRLHALLSDEALPRAAPTLMAGLLNRRLSALLATGDFATMVYALIDPARHRIAWCSAAGPAPMFVSGRGSREFSARGLPLGVRPNAHYRRNVADLPGPGILCLFSDGLYESGATSPEVPRPAIATALAEPAALAAAGQLAEAAEQATRRLEALRDRYRCGDHSDDVLAVCVAFGARAA